MSSFRSVGTAYNCTLSAPRSRVRRIIRLRRGNGGLPSGTIYEPNPSIYRPRLPSPSTFVPGTGLLRCDAFQDFELNRTRHLHSNQPSVNYRMDKDDNTHAPRTAEPMFPNQTGFKDGIHYWAGPAHRLVRESEDTCTQTHGRNRSSRDRVVLESGGATATHPTCASTRFQGCLCPTCPVCRTNSQGERCRVWVLITRAGGEMITGPKGAQALAQMCTHRTLGLQMVCLEPCVSPIHPSLDR